jgi:hypothetical protein
LPADEELLDEAAAGAVVAAAATGAVVAVLAATVVPAGVVAAILAKGVTGIAVGCFCPGNSLALPSKKTATTTTITTGMPMMDPTIAFRFMRGSFDVKMTEHMLSHTRTLKCPSLDDAPPHAPQYRGRRFSAQGSYSATAKI